MKKPKSHNSGSESLKIQHLSIDELVPYQRNPRIHSEEQIAQIAASIREFGFTNPILINASQGIIAGRGRLAAAKELGLETIPCIDLSHLSGEQKRAIVIPDNKIALNGGWNDEVLRLELTDLKELGANLELTGFDAMELADIMLGKDVEFKEYNEPAADDLPLATCPKCGHTFKTFKLNFPDVPVWNGDIAQLSVEECLKITKVQPGELDVLDGSPPCQGFSTAGKRKMDDGRNQLFRE